MRRCLICSELAGRSSTAGRWCSLVRVVVHGAHHGSRKLDTSLGITRPDLVYLRKRAHFWFTNCDLCRLSVFVAAVTSKKKTTIAVLRAALGPLDGNEQMFANTVGRSVSWVKKVSAGKRPITPKTAHRVASATGVSKEWILCGEPKNPIVEMDNKTPYTSGSYQRWRETHPPSQSKSVLDLGNVSESPAQFVHEVIRALVAVRGTGREHTAINDLWKFSKVMKARYGQPNDPYEALQLTAQLLAQVNALAGAACEVKHSPPHRDD